MKSFEYLNERNSTEEVTKTVEMLDGKIAQITLTLWHWAVLDWLDDEFGRTFQKILRDINEDYQEEYSLEQHVKWYTELYVESWAKTE